MSSVPSLPAVALQPKFIVAGSTGQRRDQRRPEAVRAAAFRAREREMARVREDEWTQRSRERADFPDYRVAFQS